MYYVIEDNKIVGKSVAKPNSVIEPVEMDEDLPCGSELVDGVWVEPVVAEAL